MAAVVDPAEIAESLVIEEIPVKLRCAACNKLAVNAFRMPCCDQSICEDCQESLPQACPVCLHEPVNKDDCRPNKALRTTIKVFLKKKGVEREGARKKEMLAQAAPTPATPITPAVEGTLARQQSQHPANPAPDSQITADFKQEWQDTSQLVKAVNSSDKVNAQPGMDIPQQSIESPGPQSTPRRASTQTAGDGSFVQDLSDQNEQPKQQAQGQIDKIQWSQNNGSGMNNNGFGFDMNAGFPNITSMGVGDFNPMMQFMPNGMPNNMMGQFPNMMSVPGMGMDPMAMSQGMFGGFGGPGMGINGMNMGMGFDAGQNAYGGFNGQPQAFNQNQYGGHANGMGGNFGANSGYGGNNMPQHQGTFNQMHQHQNFNNDFQHGYHSQGFQNRGRGRGRGGFFNAGRGRGYGPPAYQGRQSANNESSQNQSPEQTQRRGSPVYTPMQGSELEQPSQSVNNDDSGKLDGESTGQIDESQLNKEVEPGDAEEPVEKAKSLVQEEQVAIIQEPANSETKFSEQQSEADSASREEGKPRPIQSVLSNQSVDDIPSDRGTSDPAPSTMPPPTVPAIPTGPARPGGGVSALATSPRGRGFMRGFGRGFSDFRPASRGRGSVPSFDNSPHSHSVLPIEKPLQNTSISKGLGVEGAPTGPKALRQGAPNLGIKPPQDAGFSIMGRASVQPRPNGSVKSPSRSPAHSRSRSRLRSHSPVRRGSSSHRRHQRQSRSPSKESKRDKKRDRHDRSSRKDDGYYKDVRDVKESRKRDTSAQSSPRHSTHRSHRDYDKDSSRSKHRSHRSHRDRSKSHEREYRSNRKRSKSPELHISGASKRIADDSRHKGKDQDDARTSRKRRERDDDVRDYDRKRSRRDDDHVTEDIEKGHRSKHIRGEDQDSRNARKIRESPIESSAEPPKGPKVDQHALEREARNRERQMKEIQRRAVMEGKTSGSKGKTNGRVGERRASYKYEDEDLTSRVEKERESNRWG